MCLAGGRVNTGIDALEWAKKAEELGAGEILLTSMDCDVAKAGYDIELTRRVSNAKIPVMKRRAVRARWNIFLTHLQRKGGRGFGGESVPFQRN